MEFSSFDINLNDFSISYNSFTISDNSINSIVGSSGKGKTTLLKYLHGVFPNSPNLDTKYVSAENYFLFKNVYSNLDFISSDFSDIYNILFDEELSFFSNHSISDLSFGQKTRFKLLLSFFSNKSIILLDEPTHGLDAFSVDKVISCFKYVIKNKTIIVTTHDQNLIHSSSNVIEL
jgi:ABC-type lipoprotein export system ATPase subunit